jgi:hypothetical protein
MQGVESARDLLRHAVATVAYRGGKALRGAPPAFGAIRPSSTSRSAGEILAHVGDLYDWALSMAAGSPAWHASHPLEWDREVDRFFAALERFDAYLASEAPLGTTPHKLLQGPVADSLTHIGQLAMLRRVADAPVRGENYFQAEISVGRVSIDQPSPRREFD